MLRAVIFRLEGKIRYELIINSHEEAFIGCYTKHLIFSKTSVQWCFCLQYLNIRGAISHNTQSSSCAESDNNGHWPPEPNKMP